MVKTYQIEVEHQDDLVVTVFDNVMDDRGEYWLDVKDSVSGQFVEIRLTDKGRKQLRKALKK